MAREQGTGHELREAFVHHLLRPLGHDLGRVKGRELVDNGFDLRLGLRLQHILHVGIVQILARV